MPDPISSLSPMQGALGRVQGALSQTQGGQQSNDPQATLNTLQGALGTSLPGGMGAQIQEALATVQDGLKKNTPAVTLDTDRGNRTLTEGDSLRLESNGFQALTGGAVAPAFGEVVSGFLKQVNNAQQNSDALAEALAVGDEVDVHKVMLALNDASNAMSMTLQVRSHVLKAYQDLMQIPL